MEQERTDDKGSKDENGGPKPQLILETPINERLPMPEHTLTGLNPGTRVRRR